MLVSRVNEDWAVGLSGASLYLNCCVNVGISRFLVEIQTGYMSFTGMCVKTNFGIKISFSVADTVQGVLGYAWGYVPESAM